MIGWVITNAAKTRFYYVGTSKESARKWLSFKLKEQARGEKYAGPFMVRVEARDESDPPLSVSRDEFTGEQLRAAYDA